MHILCKRMPSTSVLAVYKSLLLLQVHLKEVAA